MGGKGDFANLTVKRYLSLSRTGLAASGAFFRWLVHFRVPFLLRFSGHNDAL
jgi:hypothetical protein